MEQGQEAHETSGVTTGLIIRYVRAHGGDAAVEALLRRAGVPPSLAQLEDASCWVSYETRLRLFEAATEVLGDPLCTRAMGASALRSGLNHALVLLLRALGSPAQVYRQLPRSVPKFSTTSTMEVLDCGANHATLRFRLHPGYRHSRLDCLYAQGLISMVPEVFGLLPAALVHEACESDGAAACVYRLTWSSRRRLSFLRRAHGPRVDPELVALRGQLEDLQSAASDLVGSEHVDEVLQRITQRAAAAVLAPSYLLAVHDPDGGPPRIHSEGLSTERAAALGAMLLAGHGLGAEAVVVEVASSRRSHGWLAAIYAPGQQGPASEWGLLHAYAGHAAAALDLLTALHDSRRGESRSAALLSLAHELRAATDAETVADVIAAALPGIVGCQTTTVFFWEADRAELWPIVSNGLTEPEHALLHSAPIRPDESPELIDLLTRHEPSLLEPGKVEEKVGSLLEALDLSGVIAMPLIAGNELLGVATASWRVGHQPPDLTEAFARLRGLGEYGATALQNARLVETIRHQSMHDALTGLPNRVLFATLLRRVLDDAEPGDRTALLFCDLDEFKRINDMLGHAAGDELLRQVSARLGGAVRTGDTVGRLSGDEFAILLPEVGSEDAAEALAQRVVACFEQPFRVEGLELRMTTSVGLAVRLGPDSEGELLLRAADGAMYAAKQRGRNQVARAGADAPTGGADATGDRPSLERELRAAIGRDELRLQFQPLVDITGDAGAASAPATRLVGVEALVRWQHPRLGLLPPGAFLRLAEQTGYVVELDLWAVTAACAEVAAWAFVDGQPLNIAVNLSAATLLDPRLHSTARRALMGNDLEPGQLTLEVVESRSLANLPGVTERLNALRQLGVRIALDDFGTGYSTLAWLQELPVDQLKMDRSFTSAITHDPRSLSLARGILALAQELDIELVAEGVETAEQLGVLRAAGFTLVQGYLTGRPEPGRPALMAARRL